MDDIEDSGLSYDQKIRIRQRHAISVLEGIGTLMTEAGNKNNHVVERMHLEVGATACRDLGRMIANGKISDERIDFLTWLPKPPPPAPVVVPVKKVGKRRYKTGASDYRYEDRDNVAIEDVAE